MLEEFKDELFGDKKEKKVEYLELIYDLIFVYIIGRNSSIIHHIENGFIPPMSFLTYVLCTLIIIQIWNFTNFYINRYGTNGLREHAFILINMYLLYFMADATRYEWHEYFYRYNFAWALILINMAVQYYIEYRKSKDTAPWETLQILTNMFIIGGEALFVLVLMPVYAFTGYAVTPIAMVAGIIATAGFSNVNSLVPVDFGHLTERAMLYVVFTFGEMIIAIASYFEGGFSINTIYFSLMAFLIVVGLFQIYEICYDHLIDRELITNGTGYMMIHVFLIFSLSNITTSLEFMREPEVDLISKCAFITLSFIVYFAFMLLLSVYMKPICKPDKKFLIRIAAVLILYVCVMALAYKNMYVNIGATVVMVFTVESFFIKLNKKN